MNVLFVIFAHVWMIDRAERAKGVLRTIGWVLLAWAYASGLCWVASLACLKVVS